MSRYADRVACNTTSTGTGSLTLGAALLGYRTFAQALTDGAVYYGIVDETTGDWEVGIGTLTGGTTLARTTVLSSSFGGAAVSFGVGNKTVYLPEPASVRPSLKLNPRAGTVQTVTIADDTDVGLTIRGSAAQTAALLRLHNSAGAGMSFYVAPGTAELQLSGGGLRVQSDLNAFSAVRTPALVLTGAASVNRALSWWSTNIDGTGELVAGGISVASLTRTQSTGHMSINLNTNAGVASSSFQFDLDGGLSVNSSVVRKVEGDARYLMLAGTNSMSGGLTTALVRILSDAPRIFLYDTNATSGLRNLSLDNDDGSFTVRSRQDNDTAIGTILSASRTGNVVVPAKLTAAEANIDAIAAGGASLSTVIAVSLAPPIYTNTNYALVCKGKSSSDNALTVNGLGSVGMAVVYSDFTTATAANMVITASGTLQRSTSSGDWKHDVKPISKMIPKLMALKPATFRSLHAEDGADDVYMGFIAEEVAATLPEAGAGQDGQNYDTRSIVALLTAVLQEVVPRMQTAESDITTLKNQMTTVIQKITALEQAA